LGYQILTAGDLISSVIRFYANQGGNVTDIKTRQRAEFILNRLADEFFRMAPWWFKEKDGSVTLTSGVGTLPADFDNMGLEGKIYISGYENFGPLIYATPSQVREMITISPSSGRPQFWCLYGRSSTGIPTILTYPTDNSTLLVKRYVRKVVECLDRPSGIPTLAVGAATGLTGTFLGKVTFVNNEGETEGGEATAAVTVANEKYNWSNIPLSQSPNVTARKLYRVASGGSAYRLAQTISDNLNTTFTGDATDVTATALMPTQVTATSGIEQYPDPYHLYDGLEANFMTSQGDLRDSKFKEEWTKKTARIWNDIEQGKNERRTLARYGRRGIGWWSGPLRSLGS
jgi:hypothetical protein